MWVYVKKCEKDLKTGRWRWAHLVINGSLGFTPVHVLPFLLAYSLRQKALGVSPNTGFLLTSSSADMVWTPKAWERSVCLGHQHMALLGGGAWWKRVFIPCATDRYNKTSPPFLSLLHKHHTVSEFSLSHSLAVTTGLKPQITTAWNHWSWSQSIPSFLKGCLAQIRCYNNVKWRTQKTGTGSGVVDVVGCWCLNVWWWCSDALEQFSWELRSERR